MAGTLIIARHHESEWNKLGVWQGSRDRHLTEYGFKKSTEMGELIKDVPIDYAFASMQVRSIETLSCMLEVRGHHQIPTEHASALNERDYGDYTGKNKWEMKQLVGEEAWEKIRRGWNYPIPNGETLEVVYARTVPFFKRNILPLVLEGKNVLVVAHMNSLRSLMKYIENIPDSGVENIEIPFGAIITYKLDNEGHSITKDMVQVESTVNA